MSKEEILSRIMKGFAIEDVKKIVYQYLIKNYDDVKVSGMANEVLRGNFEDLTREDIQNLLVLFGHKEEVIKEEPDQYNELANKKEETIPEQPRQKRKYTKRQKPEEQPKVQAQDGGLNLLLEEMKKLQSKINELEEKDKQKDKQIQTLSKQLDILKITENNQLIEVSDDDIDNLYIDFLKDKVTEFDSAFIIERNNTLIIPKTYYEINR